jgi:nitroreductase
VDLIRLIKERRTIQLFSAEKISDSVVNEALELSLWAPNHKNTFPWVYRIVDAAKRQKLGELGVWLKEQKGPASETTKKAVFESVTIPSHYVALGTKKSGDGKTDLENFATLACSVQIASMFLWDKGIGAKWTTSAFSMHAKTYEILGLSPEEVILRGGLFIGKAAMVPPVRQRPSLETILK